MSLIRKIIPVSLYDIPGLEHWLEEQANQGLFPTSLGSWAVFEERDVPGVRFRLDPFANRAGEGLEPTPEKLELYRAAGWEYAFRVGRAYFLFYTTDPQAPELFSDYQSQGLSLDRLSAACAPTGGGRPCCGACWVSCSWPPCSWAINTMYSRTTSSACP